MIDMMTLPADEVLKAGALMRWHPAVIMRGAA